MAEPLPQQTATASPVSGASEWKAKSSSVHRELDHHGLTRASCETAQLSNAEHDLAVLQMYRRNWPLPDSTHGKTSHCETVGE